MATLNKVHRKDKDQTVLQKMDICAPSVDLQHKGEKTKRTMTGGFLSIFTVSLFFVLMSIKIVDKFSLETPSFSQMKRMLGVAPQSDPKANPSAYNFYSEANFKFNNLEQTFIDPGVFYKPLNMKSYFVEELNIVLNNEYNYAHTQIGNLAEMVTNGAEAQVKQNVNDKKLYKERIEDANSDIGGYFEFEMVTTYIEGQGRKTTYGVPQYQVRKIYSLDDFTLDESDIIYKLNVAPDVSIVGDFNNLDLTQMKQYVDFNININWIKIQAEAQKKANNFFSKDIPKNGGSIIKSANCVNDYDDGDNYKTYTDERKGGLLQLFDADNNYITDPSGGYIKAKSDFVKDIKNLAGAEEDYDKTKFSSSDDEFYARLKIDLNTCHTVEWKSSTESILNTNAAGQPINNSGSPYTTLTGTTPITSADYTYTNVVVASNGTNVFNWEDIYRAKLRSVFFDIWEQQQNLDRLFDSIIVEYKPAGAQKKQLISLNNVDYDCFWQSIQGNVTQGAKKQEDSAKCTKDVNIAEFKLLQQQVQDINMYTHKEAEVTKPKQLYNRLVFNENKKLSYKEYLSLPFPGTPKQMFFNNLWTTRFTMSQTGYLSTEVWFVQDQDEKRTSSTTGGNKRLLEEQRANQKSAIKSVGQEEGVFTALRIKAISQKDTLELVAYAAGLWIFLSFSIGHMVQKVQQTEVVAPVQEYNKVNETETEEELEKALDDILTEEQKEFIKSQQ